MILIPSAVLLCTIFGHLPERDEQIVVGKYQFTVIRADNRRIHLLAMTMLDEHDVEENEDHI